MDRPIVEMAIDVEKTLLEVITGLTGRQVEPTISINGLRDFGIDSLGVYQVICEVEQRLGISVPDTALQNDDATLQELAQGIQALLYARS